MATKWVVGLGIVISACAEPFYCDQPLDCDAEAGTDAGPSSASPSPEASNPTPALSDGGNAGPHSAAPAREADAGQMQEGILDMTEAEIAGHEEAALTGESQGEIDLDSEASADGAGFDGHDGLAPTAQDAGVEAAMATPDAVASECEETTTRPCANVFGNCANGVETCENGTWSECSIQATDEDRCDVPSDDSNCDDTSNGGCKCVDGEQQPCDSMTNQGQCSVGRSTCKDEVWGECVGAQGPLARDCTSSNDNDCDGFPDDTIDGSCKCEVGAESACGEEEGSHGCRVGVSTCATSNAAATSDWSACEYEDVPDDTPCDDEDASTTDDACSDGLCLGESDDVAPTVQSVTPADGALDIQPDGTIVATFSEAMNQATITSSSFFVNGPEGSVAGTISFPTATQAKFTPSTPFGLLRQYDISITTAITDIAGNSLGQLKNSSFTTRDGAWGFAQLLESDDADSSTSPQLAVGANGDAIAVWMYDTNAVSRRYYNGNWGSTDVIEEDVSVARVGMDANGKAIAVWITNDIAVGYRLITSVGFGSKFELDDRAYSIVNLGFAVNSEGKALLNWSDTDYQLVSRYFDGTTWSPPENIDGAFQNPYYGSLIDRDLLFASDGSALCAWHDQEGTLATKTTKYAPSTGFASTAGAVGSYYDAHVELAGDPATTALAVWAEGNNIYANEFTDGNWGSREALENSAGAAGAPQVAMSATGDGIAVWAQSDGSHVNIYHRSYSGGAWVGTPSTIETSNADAVGPQVVMDPGGNGFALWGQDNPKSLFVSRYNADEGTWAGGASPVESGDGAVSQPQLAVDNRGRAIAVWTQANGSRTDIYYNRFE